MRIGVITYWNSSDNYGQQLQCYALQTVLRSWGHDAFLIRYSPERPRKTIFQKVINNLLHPKYLLKHIPFETIIRRDARIEEELKIINDRNNPIRGFEQFRKDNLKMTETIYRSFPELVSNPPEADAYITGSDQVWYSSFNEEAIKGYFLMFGSDQIKRLSYAASIGRILDKKEQALLPLYLKHFDAISVREESARQQCVKQGVKAQVCIDPTMLLDIAFYRKIAKTTNDNRYAFLYVLNVKSAEEFNLPAIRNYVEEKGFALKSVTGSGYCQGRELIENSKNLLATIPEWLGYMNDARCVFTTSFHGTVFSVLMHRPFLTIGLQGTNSHSNARMEQLLSKLGIPERMFDPQKSIREQMDSPIDWAGVDLRLTELRQSSIDYLRENLK